MGVSYDPKKCSRNVRERGLSFELVRGFEWSGAYVLEDVRRDYGEPRFQALGEIDGRLHMLVFTPRGGDVHVISACVRRIGVRSNVMRKKRKSRVSDENPEWTSEDFSRARPAREVLPSLYGTKTAAEMLKPRGRPRSPNSKVAISLRLAPDVLDRWKASGTGWQTRMAESLRKHAPLRRGNS
jgi:uncharacterized protein (DUF4415 family)/uncharacterized DUF497 family protein